MGYRLNKIKILILDGSTEIVVDVFEILKDVFAEVVHNDLWPRGVQTRFRAVDQEWQVKHGSDIIIALAIIFGVFVGKSNKLWICKVLHSL